MSATTEDAATLSRQHGHRRCLLCGEDNPWSLGLSFAPGDDGSVRAGFAARPSLQGYEGMLHGGVVAALLDAAMTHCLFQKGVQAVTGDLHVRYREAVPCDASLEIQAWLREAHPPLFSLKAQIRRDGRLLAWAEAKFVQRREPRKTRAPS